MRRTAKLISFAATLSLIMTLLLASSTLSVGPPDNFVAPLNGGEEVPARDTNAHGAAKFWVSSDGLTISWILIASNIDNVVASHIHVGAVGTNGPVVLFLFGSVAPGGGRHDGVLATGTATAGSLVGPLAGHPLSDLIAAMNAGNAYVNVHTNDGVAPPDTGPGDFPGGEIRGQIQ
jgi:hypothetical protein